MKRPWLLWLSLVAALFLSGWFFKSAEASGNYNGLPTVNCIDPTNPPKHSFNLTLSVAVKGQPVALPAQLGHDYGNCLHEIYTNDPSGRVIVQSDRSYTLGDIFKEWHKRFDKTQIFNKRVGDGYQIHVLVNGQLVDSADDTPLTPGAVISVNYDKF